MVEAFILIKSDVGREKNVLKDLNSISGIVYAHIVYGTYDLICRVKSDTIHELKDKVSSQIRVISGVQNTVSMILV